MSAEHRGTSFQAQITDARRPALRRYQETVVGGTGGIWSLANYEIRTALLEGARGAWGYWARGKFYRPLFGKLGRGVVLGRELTLRHPSRIEIGDNVAIDDGCLLDGRGQGGGASLVIGSAVIVSRNSVLSSKDGVLMIGVGCNIGAECLLYASHGRVIVEDHVLFAARCYIGGGRYHHDRLDVPIMEQGQYFRGDTVIESGCWLGAGAVVLDGVRVGRGCIIGAGAVVTGDLPPYSIAIGVPARVVRTREEGPVAPAPAE